MKLRQILLEGSWVIGQDEATAMGIIFQKAKLGTDVLKVANMLHKSNIKNHGYEKYTKEDEITEISGKAKTLSENPAKMFNTCHSYSNETETKYATKCFKAMYWCLGNFLKSISGVTECQQVGTEGGNDFVAKKMYEFEYHGLKCFIDLKIGEYDYHRFSVGMEGHKETIDIEFFSKSGVEKIFKRMLYKATNDDWPDED